jgi:hypothetical protein
VCMTQAKPLFHELESTIKKWLLIGDTGLIKILVATVLANRLPVEPVWLLIVAPPGGAKTELLSGLKSLDDTYFMSDLTPQTFLSGDKGSKNSSLLMRLPEQSILILKDFTTVLEMHPDKRSAILSQLREIYDGDYRKEFGTGESKIWQGKLGFMAGVTPIIDQHQAVYQTLGERFIQYRPIQADRFKVSMRAINNSGNEKLMRQELQAAFASCINSIELPSTPMQPPEEYKQRIAKLAMFCSQARSSVVRNGNTRLIELLPDIEVPTRLVKQYINLFSGLALISGGYTEADYQLIYKIGMDSLPSIKHHIIEFLYASDTPQTLKDIASISRYPDSTIRNKLEELEAVGVLHSRLDSGSLSYLLQPEITELLNEVRVQPRTDDTLEQVHQIFFDGKGLPEISEGMDKSNAKVVPMNS